MRAAHDLLAARCPSRDVLNRIGGRWVPTVLNALDPGPLRFTELKKVVDGVTAKALTETLRALEYDGIVDRIETPSAVPPRVDYSLTPLGRSLLEVLTPVREWAEQHVGDIAEARRRHDPAPRAAAG
ncbi:transcriptional regulator [Amycolatopsis balhimycina DSM 5908]|uniref:Transcriptional regulator n=1 Tax=Amycolatopsis balhimycina DSM 5908 TaxID=1081091 RepID=A0A428WRV3_AMYBA|nr:helix-turn-helix domain-containing protein [Amycolatopsis balhimycina]RSM45794.1 transcriptional regulator [Amycolatopsis balhimycina DSM 5908]